MMDLVFRRLRRHWRLNLAVLSCLTLASALLAGLAVYGAVLSARELDRSLAQASPAERCLLIDGSLYTFGDALYADLQERLGSRLKGRVVIRHATLPADPRPTEAEAGPQVAVARLEVYSFDRLPEGVHLVAGRLPEPLRLREAVGNWPPPAEAVIGRQAAEQSGYGPGDRLTASGLYHRLEIVGIVEPLDPDDELWGGDLGAFAVPTGTHEFGAGEIALPLIIAPESMQSYLGGPIFAHEVAWRINLDTDRLSPATAAALHSTLVNFQTQSATRGARTSTGLLHILAGSLARLARLRMALWLLAAQTLILVLYALAILAAFVADHARAEVATLSAWGIGAWQIGRVFVLENLLLALPAALLLGPGLAQAAVYLWGLGVGLALPARWSGEMWLLSALAAGMGWLALVVPIFWSARRCHREPQPARARPPQRSALHRRYVDLYLLAFGGLLVWQLNRSGSFLARAVAGSRLGDIPLADPLLLLGPWLLLIAVALIFLRIVPWLLGLVARLVRGQRGLLLPLGLLHPSRDPLPPSRLVLLVSLTVGLVLFARILGDSLARGQAALRADELVQGIAGAWQLNALLLALFGVTAFFLAHLVAARGRGCSPEGTCEPGILRAMGLPAGRWPLLPVLEGGLVLALGLPAGAAMGVGLAYALLPYLSPAVVEPLVGAGVEQIVLAGPAIARTGVILLALYSAALVLLWLILRQWRAQRPLWQEDE